VAKFNFRAHRWPPSDWNGDTKRFKTNAEYQRAPLASGSFRDAYLGWDSKTNQTVVAKRFRKGHPTEERFWREDILAADVAARYAAQFNEHLRSSKPVRVVKPVVDFCAGFGSGSPFKQGECVLIEPFLGRDYKKFNSNSGWVNNDCGVSMAALSHFSYHISKGRELLCDLQGVKDKDEYVLTDPVICSSSGEKYGLTDCGKAGMVKFFRRHKCTALCNPSWLKMSDAEARNVGDIPTIRGTTFKRR